jgi:hypothetical protein
MRILIILLGSVSFKLTVDFASQVQRRFDGKVKVCTTTIYNR